MNGYSRLEDAKIVNTAAAKETGKSLLFLPLLALLWVAYELIQILIGILLGRMSMGGSAGLMTGILAYIVKIFLYSHFVGVLSGVVSYRRLNANTLTDGFQRYFAPVSQVVFVLYIAQLLLGRIGGNLLPSLAILSITILLYLYLSATPEMIYIGGSNGYEAIMTSIDFWKENWHAWGPVAVLAIIVQQTIGVQLRVYFLVLTPGLLIRFVIAEFILGLIIALFMVYMGHLYAQLQGTSMRGRAFKRSAGNRY